ncbi:MAG: CRTAC1 family protein [Candidatus Limnocylindrales bacterium]
MASRRRALAALGIVVVALLAAGVAGVTVLGVGRGPEGLGPPHFVDEAASAGLDFTFQGDSDLAVAGGVAVFDCNGDGKPDLYLAGGSGPAGLFRNDSPVGGALRFTRLRDPATDLSQVVGAYPIDIDGDGIVDLVVLRLGETTLLKGLGNCRFEVANAAWSFAPGTAFSTAFSATWEGSAALPTLAIGHYLGLDGSGKVTSDCADNQLFRPDSAGTGYGPPQVLAPGYCTLSVLFSDWNRSGQAGLRMSNDRQYYVGGQEQLWRIPAGGSPRPYSSADGWQQLQIFGMGIASYDVTGDGYPEVFLTSQADNKLQTLTNGPGQPTYGDIALEHGVTSAEPNTGGDVLPSTAWHPEFQDVNNDGLIDLFVSKGNVNAEEGFATKDPSDLFLGQPDGTFRQAADAAGILNFERGRGAALADFNLDGLLDLVEVNYGAPVRLWRSTGSGSAAQPAPMGNWLALLPQQAGPNRSAIGAWIELNDGSRTIQRELTIGGGHLSGELGWVHFGIGSARQAQVRIHWPGGETGPWLTLAANTFDTIERGATAAQPWSPAGH